MAIDNLIETTQSLARFDAEAELISIVEENKEKITELQQQQLAAGIDITGQPRHDEYRPYTIEQKQKFGVGLGAVTDRVTFFMKGDLYNSLRTNITGKEFRVESPLATFDKMIERIGEEDYGLDETSRLEFAETIVIPRFSEALLQQTGLQL